VGLAVGRPDRRQAVSAIVAILRLLCGSAIAAITIDPTHPAALESEMHANGTLRIRIVGGSLGGLFAAALLRMDGHQIRIYERSVSGLGGRGAGLVGQRDIFAILRAVGCEHVAHV
jgi:hypothetical protein